MDLSTIIYIAMGIDENYLSKDIVDYYLDAWGEVYSNEWQIVHNTILSCYEYLIRASSSEASGGGTRDESNAVRRITLTNYNKSSDWESAMRRYLKAPWQVLPQYRKYMKPKLGISIIGVRRDKVANSNRNKNKFDQFSEHSPYEANPHGVGDVSYKDLNDSDLYDLEEF